MPRDIIDNSKIKLIKITQPKDESIGAQIVSLVKILSEVERVRKKERIIFDFSNLCWVQLRDLDYSQDNAEKLFDMAYGYLNYLTEEYNHDLSNIIYMTIKNEMQKKHHFDKWHKLFLKYLKKEKESYDNNFANKKTVEMYWWPSFYNEDILLLIHEELGKDKFLEAFNIISKFPKELEIHDSGKIISLLEGFPKTNETVKEIIARLFKKNPSKYYELRNK